MIVITSKKHGFRRGGIAHPKGPVEYPDDRFTAEELAVLEAEPMLTVVVKAAETGKRAAGKKEPADQKD